MARKPAELRPIMTRIPERLRRRLERKASDNKQSMNAEINQRLEQSFTNENVEKENRDITATLNAMTELRAREGQVMAMWLAGELRSRNIPETTINELIEVFRAYKGTPAKQSGDTK